MQLAPIKADTAAALAVANTRAIEAFGKANAGNITAALEVAEAVQDLRRMFDDPGIRSRVEALQDTPIGFRTDRDPKVKNRKTGQPNEPYGYDVVKDCAIEAGLRGLQLVGNQWNILSGRMYCTKEGFEFLIKGLKDIANFKLSLGIPVAKGAHVTIDCEAEWLNQGVAQSLKAQIPVKHDDYSTADQSLGKAKRKFLQRCHEQMTGTVMPEGEVEADPKALPVTPPNPATQFQKPPTLQEQVRDAVKERGVKWSELEPILVGRGYIKQGDKLSALSDEHAKIVLELIPQMGGAK
jgi:hypothetical protein